jgi:hypothetical protein
MTKIYISSTYSDLVEHRQQAYDILRKMRYDMIAMEDYVATDQRPLDECLGRPRDAPKDDLRRAIRLMRGIPRPWPQCSMYSAYFPSM